MNQKTIGVCAIIIASLMWALEPIFAKLSYNTSDTLQTMFFRSIIFSLIALVYILFTNKDKNKLDKKNFYVLFYIALIGTIFCDFLYLYAISQIPVVNAVLIGHMQPIFILIFGYILLKENINKHDYIGICFMILAGIIVSTKNIENFMSFKFGSLGDLFVLLATIGWATTAIATKKYLSKLNAGTITFYRGIIALFFLSLFILFKSQFTYPNLYQILLGFFVGIGTIFYYEGLKRIKAIQVSSLELSTPFFASILAFLILGEKINLFQIIGIVLLIFGVYFLSKKESN
jgi:drug/metabolite transporter (DMT)-like permease